MNESRANAPQSRNKNSLNLRSLLMGFLSLVFGGTAMLEAQLSFGKEFSGREYAGPLIDAHNHWNGSRDAKQVASLMRMHNVVAVVFMPRAYGSKLNSSDLPTTDEDTLTALLPYRGIFFPTVGMQLPFLTDSDWGASDKRLETLYIETERKLATGDFYGIGEVIVRHYPYFKHPSVPEGGKNMDVRKSLDSEHVRRLAQIAGKYEVPLLFHMEGEPSLVAGAEKVFTENPKTTFIWSHMCGRISATELSRLLSSHSNLLCDMAGMTNTGPTGYGFAIGRDYPERSGWPQAFSWTHIIESNGEYFPEVKDLILTFPNRFLGVGMDTAHGPLPSRVFLERLQRFRLLLGTLPLDIAQKLGCSNAKAVWKINVDCQR